MSTLCNDVSICLVLYLLLNKCLAGANVGMFALYVGHHTRKMHQDHITIIAIEPMQANFTLLQQNMHLHKVRGRCYRCAVGTSLAEPIGTNEKNAALSKLSDTMAVFGKSYDPDGTRDSPTNSKVSVKRCLCPCCQILTLLDLYPFSVNFADDDVLPAHAWQLLQYCACGLQHGAAGDAHEPQSAEKSAG